jgi:predicted membrane-bound spermidine synthase/Tfp pilus assembly protein PilF
MTTMYRVFLIYALSGFVSLGYQVAWFRIYVDLFGSTNLTFALVVCNFIGGLGLGALISARFCSWLSATFRIRDRLRLYGLIEVLVALAVTPTIFAKYVPADTWGTFPYHLVDGIFEPNLAYQLSKLGIAVLCVFVPCLFMGITFPLLCDIYRGVRSAERFPSALYAWNTLGACSGVLACLFLLLLAIGLFFIVLGGARAEDAPSASGGNGAPPDAATQGPGLLLTCAVLSGLLAGALEGDMFKRIDFVSSGDSALMALISFWAILGIFLASWAVRVVSAITLNWIKVAYVVGFCLYAAVWIGEGFVRKAFWWLEVKRGLSEVSEQEASAAGFHREFLHSLDHSLLYVALFVFPAYFCVSLLLPYVCNRIHGRREHLGLAYGLNTLAFCAGMIGFTLVAPSVSVFYSLKLMFGLFAVVVILLMLISESRRLSLWKPIAATAAFAGVCALTPGGFDRDFMVHPLATEHAVRALKSNGAHTSFVVSAPGGDWLFFERHPMSSTKLPEGAYMRLMAHFPLLAQPDPKRVLLICYGVGSTASAIAAHETVEAIDVVDLNEKVIETAPEFAESTNSVHLDPRIRFIVDDGRNFLNLCDGSYDLVTSEPPPPMQAGVYRLYTREYYQQVLDHLTPHGMMTQWLPTYQMPESAVEMSIRTFVNVFPHALIFTGGHRDYIMVGSPSPIDLRLLEQRFHEQPAVTAALRRMGITQPLALIARVVQGDRTLRRRFSEGRVIGDSHNDIDFLFHNPDDREAIGYAPFEVLADIDADRLGCGRELRAVMTHLGRLRYHVPRHPTPSLLAGRHAETEGVRLADRDWAEVIRILDPTSQLQKAGRKVEAVRAMREALELEPEQPLVLLHLASLHLELGGVTNALTNLEQFRRLEPNAEAGYRMLGLAKWRLGRRGEAIMAMRTAVRLDPYSADAHHALGELLIKTGNLEEGMDHLAEALALQPRRDDARRLLNATRQRLELPDAVPSSEGSAD